MKKYTLKSIGKNTDYMTILREMEDGFVVQIVRDMDGYEDIKTDYISKELFDSCIRTGYLTEITETVKMAVNKKKKKKYINSPLVKMKLPGLGPRQFFFWIASLRSQ